MRGVGLKLDQLSGVASHSASWSELIVRTIGLVPEPTRNFPLPRSKTFWALLDGIFFMDSSYPEDVRGCNYLFDRCP